MTSHWRLLLKHLNDPGRDTDPEVTARAAADLALRQDPPPDDLLEAVMGIAATTFATAITAGQARRALLQAGSAARRRGQPGPAH